MADRVFPNSTNVDMGSKLTFNTIDWGDVESNMHNNRFAEDQTEKIKELLRLSEASCDTDDDDDGDKESSSHAKSSEAEEFFLEEKTASNNNKTMKKIAFTNPEQISAEAIERAQKAGDTDLVQKILAARKANRTRIAKAIEGKLQKQSQIEQLSEESLQKLANSYGDSVPSAISSKLSKKASKDVFASPTDFSPEQRQSFEKIAMSLGFPKKYVEAMCNKELSSEVVELNNDIKSIYASSVSESKKESLVKKLVREASLTPESKKEFVDYWNNTLGYQDKEFWPAVAADYEDDKKVN
jgi:hypothetical protein